MSKLKTGLVFALSSVLLLSSSIPYVLAACPDPDHQVETGVGCVPTDAPGLAAFLVRLVVGIAGGVALLLLIVGGAQFIASGGDPDSLDEAKEKITAAVSGLLLIIFSLLMLKIIGVDILGLPDFEGLPGGGVRLPGP